ncbi:50S ribosomal protein L28 [Henriciella marina]|uniref:50S ribosomal protein L28 n=1 Tax=Henriciella marina TaxID=453851 RepID=UPI00035D9B40|nr:50S ribosomal protein L28 [Henriciella marina]
MARQCELSGVKPITGNRVSHSNVKSKRRFLPNLVNVTLRSDALDRNVSLRIAAKTLRTVDKLGGLDGYLAQSKDDTLSPKALKVKRDLQKQATEAAEAEA